MVNETINTTDNNKDWDLIIQPKKHLLDIDLHELWKYRDLIILFVQRDFKARFKQTILGPLWFVLNPLLSTFIYTIIFNRIAQIPTEGKPSYLFYLAGIIGWNYFAACLNGTSSTFTGNAGIFGKVYFPRLVVPISTIISNLFQFFIQFGLFLAFMIYYSIVNNEIYFTYGLIYVPFILILLSLIAFGFGILISSLTTKYRDLSNLLGFGMQLWMYATPIIYPISFIPKEYKIFVLLNPIAPLIEAFKFGLIGGGSINWYYLCYSLGFTVVVVIAGVLVFNKVENTFMDTV